MNNTRARERASPRHAARGMSLIELMVALLIASIVTLAIFAVMSTFEGRKRTTTSVNDANQAGNYAMHLLDKLVRSAGSGFVQAGSAAQRRQHRSRGLLLRLPLAHGQRGHHRTAARQCAADAIRAGQRRHARHPALGAGDRCAFAVARHRLQRRAF
jgi:prepilin-type N-terminal cleavage/methylation domain-containing protein